MSTDDLIPDGLGPEWDVHVRLLQAGEIAPEDFMASWERKKRARLQGAREKPLERPLSLRGYQRALRHQTQVLRLRSHRPVRFIGSRRAPGVSRGHRWRRLRTSRTSHGPPGPKPGGDDPPPPSLASSRGNQPRSFACSLRRAGGSEQR